MNSEFLIAVHSLVLLAYLPDHMATSDTIAENVSTHPARIRKIMGFLRRAGYVETKEGTGGGYMLSCDPEQVTLSELYRMIAFGKLKPNWCPGDPEMDCMVSSNMEKVMNRILWQAELQLESYLRNYTISDVLRQIKQLREECGCPERN